MIKSNNGPDSCCYQYCSQESVYQSVCTFCNLSSNDDAKSAAGFNITSAQNKIVEKVYEHSKSNNEFPPQTCQLVPGLSLTTSRCEIPYYASSASSATTLHHWVISTGCFKNIFLIHGLICLLKFIHSCPLPEISA